MWKIDSLVVVADFGIRAKNLKISRFRDRLKGCGLSNEEKFKLFRLHVAVFCPCTADDGLQRVVPKAGDSRNGTSRGHPLQPA